MSEAPTGQPPEDRADKTLAQRLESWPYDKVYGFFEDLSPGQLGALASSVPNKVGRIVKERYSRIIGKVRGLIDASQTLDAMVRAKVPGVSFGQLREAIGAVIVENLLLSDAYNIELAAKEKAMDGLAAKLSNETQKHLEVIRQNRELYTQIMTDPLTGIYSRRFFFTDLPEHLKKADKHGEPLSVILFDINNFKLINDTYDHEGGDFMLKEIAKLARETLPKAYVVARLGGDEFGIIVPKATEQDAYNIAEELRKKVFDTKFIYTIVEGDQEYDCGINTTIALGVKQHERGDSADELYRGADAAFYVAHKLGKNRTIRYSGFEMQQKDALQDTTVKHKRNIIAVRQRGDKVT